MSKRKITDPIEKAPEALQSAREVYSAGGHLLTEQEEGDFLARRGLVVDEADAPDWVLNSPWVAVRRHAHLIERRGEFVYRKPGKAGADLRMPPWAWRDAVAERDRLAEIEKQRRQPRIRQARTERAVDLATRVLKLAEADTARGRYKRIARMAGCSLPHVYRILGKLSHQK